MMELLCPVCDDLHFLICDFCTSSTVEYCDCCGGTGMGESCSFCQSQQYLALQAEHDGLMKHFEELKTKAETMVTDFSKGSDGRLIRHLQNIKNTKEELVRVESRLLDMWIKELAQQHISSEPETTA